MTPLGPFLTEREAAAYLTLSPSTLNRWRVIGGGPAFRRLGRRVAYAMADLHAFADARSATHTGSPRAA